MHILVTNDDGIFAPGIRALSAAFSRLGDVTIVAPDRERSATGHAITVHSPLRVKQITGLPATTAYAVNGTPADCVKLALEGLKIEKLDLVVSGVNRGPNLGTDVLYSGTVSAAIEAALLGLPAIAVSLADFRETDYEDAADFAAQIAKRWQHRRLPPDTLLNVNWPRERARGVKITFLGQRRYENIFDLRTDPWGREYYWLGGAAINDETPESDVWAIENGYASVTPIHFDLTNYRLIAEVESWKLDRELTINPLL